MTKVIEKLIAENKWRPIEDAPKDEEILITDGYSVCTALYRISNCSQDKPFYATTANGEIYNVGYDWQTEPQYIPATHFRPFPDDRLARVCDLFLKAIEAALDDPDSPENVSMFALALKEAEQIAGGE